MNLFDMLRTENMCSSRGVSMCQNNHNLYSYKLIFHSYLLFGKCNTSSYSFIYVCHSGRHSVQLTPKKRLHCIRHGFNVKLQILAMIWNIIAQRRGDETGTQK